MKAGTYFADIPFPTKTDVNTLERNEQFPLESKTVFQQLSEGETGQQIQEDHETQPAPGEFALRVVQSTAGATFRRHCD